MSDTSAPTPDSVAKLVESLTIMADLAERENADGDDEPFPCDYVGAARDYRWLAAHLNDMLIAVDRCKTLDVFLDAWRASVPLLESTDNG